jgi:hypothetical protein
VKVFIMLLTLAAGIACAEVLANVKLGKGNLPACLSSYGQAAKYHTEPKR